MSDSKRLFKSLGSVSGVTMLSRVLGYLRDMIIAAVFGAGAATDVFFVAFRIPNFLRRLFGEGAFSQAFVPVLSEYQQTRQADVKDLIDHVVGVLFISLIVVTVVAMLAAPWLVLLIAPGFSAEPDKLLLATQLLRITFPYLLFISLTAAAMAILNSRGYFAAPAFSPVLLNLSMILSAVLFAGNFDQPITALAWGVFAGGIAQLLWQVPFLMRLRLLPRIRFGWGHSGTKRVLILMVPTLFGAGVAQINLLFDTFLASFLQSGSISWLYYSDRLLEFPLGVFAIALATIMLPDLSRRHALKDVDGFQGMLDWGTRLALLIGLPAAAALAVLATPLISTLFQYGEFDARAVQGATLSLWAYAPGLLGAMLVKIFAPGFFARQNTRAPVRIGIIALTTNMVFNLILIVPLQHAGLALATSMSAFLHAGLLYRGLRSEGVFKVSRHSVRLVFKAILATILMAVWLFWLAGLTDWLISDGLQKSGALLLCVVSGTLVYAGALFLCGVRHHDLKTVGGSRHVEI
ncbi:MAG: murein biosynthesis integral membrane protein MurJ [Gammaproteobacteria bacterium]|nr:MAG: murein biosynthesis integral membrane protein MurJ [Gammaproteobacteria bacterium]RLA11782.1 MAG: murein biosynthesis integral membrane protein MurJ [Gammaproteobacteria bacterium]